MVDVLTVTSVIVAVSIAASQLAQEGLQQFLYRPPGVGASPSEHDSTTADAATKQSIAEPKPPVPRPAPDLDALGIVLIMGGISAVGAVLLLGILGRVQGDDPSSATSY